VESVADYGSKWRVASGAPAFRTCSMLNVRCFGCSAGIPACGFGEHPCSPDRSAATANLGRDAQVTRRQGCLRYVAIGIPHSAFRTSHFVGILMHHTRSLNRLLARRQGRYLTTRTDGRRWTPPNYLAMACRVLGKYVRLRERWPGTSRTSTARMPVGIIGTPCK
jgi:hypothetical protein